MTLVLIVTVLVSPFVLALLYGATLGLFDSPSADPYEIIDNEPR
jgi:hypothetical protein